MSSIVPDEQGDHCVDQLLLVANFLLDVALQALLFYAKFPDLLFAAQSHVHKTLAYMLLK